MLRFLLPLARSLPPSALVPSPSPLSFFALQSAFWPRSGKAVAQIAAAAAIAANERTNDEHIIARSQFANPQVARVHCRSVALGRSVCRPGGGGAEAAAVAYRSLDMVATVSDSRRVGEA